MSTQSTEAAQRRDKRDLTAAEKASRSDRGEDQRPVQSEDDSSTTWDSPEHSDAPGPFGTGAQ